MIIKNKVPRQTDRILLATGYTPKEVEAIQEKINNEYNKPDSVESLDEVILLQQEIYDWARDVFGDERFVHQRLAEMNKSIIDEAKELTRKPYSLYEFADLFITMLNSLSAADYTFIDLIAASKVKLIINKGRKWFRKHGKIYHKEKNEL